MARLRRWYAMQRYPLRSAAAFGLVAGSLVVTALAWASDAAQAPDPVGWLARHWTQTVTGVAAFLVVWYVRRLDEKFAVLFAWKTEVDGVLGVHAQVWGHGEGCGPIWVHHRADGQSALHFRASDHPGLCERCHGLQGRVVE